MSENADRSRDYESRVSTTEAERIAVAAAKLAATDSLNELLALFGVARGNAESVDQFKEDLRFVRALRRREAIWQDLEFFERSPLGLYQGRDPVFPYDYHHHNRLFLLWHVGMDKDGAGQRLTAPPAWGQYPRPQEESAMGRHRFTLAAFSLSFALALAGCGALGGALGLPTVGGAVGGAIPQTVAADALKAAQIALATYADVYQPAVIHYGQLPDCPGAALCKTRATLNRLKAVDANVVRAINAAQLVLNSNIADTGQIAAAVQAIKDFGAELSGTGILPPAS